MKSSVYVATSLDGYIARENGALDWLPQPEEDKTNGEDYGFKEFFNSVDALIMGRNTYEMVRSFKKWPYETKRVIVLSSNQIKIPDELSEVIENRSCSPADLIEELEKDGVDRIYIDGGKTIQGFLNAGLIDEIIITRIPILIGQGIPLFGKLDKDIELRHINTQSFENGIVQSKYEVI